MQIPDYCKVKQDHHCAELMVMIIEQTNNYIIKNNYDTNIRNNSDINNNINHCIGNSNNNKDNNNDDDNHDNKKIIL